MILVARIETITKKNANDDRSTHSLIVGEEVVAEGYLAGDSNYLYGLYEGSTDDQQIRGGGIPLLFVPVCIHRSLDGTATPEGVASATPEGTGDDEESAKQAGTDTGDNASGPSPADPATSSGPSTVPAADKK